MKKLLSVLMCLMFLGCGKQGPAGSQGPKGDTGDQGEVGPKGDDGSNGIDGKDGVGGGIEKVKIIPYSNADLCSYNTIECAFNGGQVVYFEDGSVLLTGSYSYYYYNNDNTDKDQNSISFIVGKEFDIGWIRLDFEHENDGNFGHLYMAYNKTEDKVIIVSDTDDSNSLTENDEILLTLYPTE